MGNIIFKDHSGNRMENGFEQEQDWRQENQLEGYWSRSMGDLY